MISYTDGSIQMAFSDTRTAGCEMTNWLELLDGYSERPCFLGGPAEQRLTYGQLSDRIKTVTATLDRCGIGPNSVVAFSGQYAAANVAMLLAIADVGAVAVPLPENNGERVERLLQIAGVTDRVVTEPETGTMVIEQRNDGPAHALYCRLRELDHAGLVLFTSGSTGDPKAAVQDLDTLRLRYTDQRRVGKMLAFMQIDHIGGINTLLYVLTHGGTLVVPKTRSPEDVAQIIERHRIEVLPVSPTFLNLLLISGVFSKYDLSSLRRVTYGSEPMPESLLKRLGEVLSGVEFLQTYGTTEMGILKSKSESNDSLWMKVGGEGYETKIVDNRLWIRSQTAMLGYLNAPSPFDAEGFMDTGDEVQLRGEWLKILGRKSEFINVGGTKVSPTEVESVLQEMSQVCEASVNGMPHPLMGQVVRATVRLNGDANLATFKSAMRTYCEGRLPAEAIPVKVTLTDQPLVTERFKRARDE